MLLLLILNVHKHACQRAQLVVHVPPPLCALMALPQVPRRAMLPTVHMA